MEFKDLKHFKEEFQTLEDFRMSGKFICENSLNTKVQRAYSFTVENRSLIKYYYSILGFDIIFDAGYFYFVKETLTETEMNNFNKQFLDNFADYIDIHRFLKLVDSGLTSNSSKTFNISTLEERINKDIELKTAVSKMRFIKKKETYRVFIESLMHKMQNDGFVDSFYSKEGKYILLKSYKYVEDIVEDINIEE